MDARQTGAFIAALRKEKGYTQKELAGRLGVSDKAVSRWETGKGFPDTALLPVLGETLGVSVGELLAGQHMEMEQAGEAADRVILDTLAYGKRMRWKAAGIACLAAGAALLASPLYLAGGSMWSFGLVLALAGAMLLLCGHAARRTGTRVPRIAPAAFQALALALELLPLGTVLRFASGPGETAIKTYSYFSLTPFGYANFTPLLTGVLTVAALLVGVSALWDRHGAEKRKNAAFLLALFTFVCSLLPLVIFGRDYMTAVSYAVSAALAVSTALRAAANRTVGR